MWVPYPGHKEELGTKNHVPPATRMHAYATWNLPCSVNCTKDTSVWAKPGKLLRTLGTTLGMPTSALPCWHCHQHLHKQDAQDCLCTCPHCNPRWLNSVAETKPPSHLLVTANSSKQLLSVADFHKVAFSHRGVRPVYTGKISSFALKKISSLTQTDTPIVILL